MPLSIELSWLVSPSDVEPHSCYGNIAVGVVFPPLPTRRKRAPSTSAPAGTGAGNDNAVDGRLVASASVARPDIGHDMPDEQG